MYIRKTYDTWDIEGYYGAQYGWECVNTELTWKDAKRSVKEYRDNDPQHSYRIVKKRIRKEQ